MFRRIVIASDGSQGAAQALTVAINLAKTHAADLHMTSVEELPQFPASVGEVVEEKSATNNFYEAVIRSTADRLSNSHLAPSW